MMVLSLVWRRSGDKPFEAFGKDSGVAQKAEARDDGPSGPATSISPAMARLLRPSVQLPAGTCGWRALYGFWPPWQGKGRPSGPNFASRRVGGHRHHSSALDFFVCIAYKESDEDHMAAETAPNAPAGDPKHAVRATRTAGRKMRSLLLDAASRLFKERGLSGTSIADIATAADAFPSQITYYFRTKEALFVEAACRDMLCLARSAEQAALRAGTPRDYTRALIETVTATDSVAFFAEALTLTRRRPDLAPLVERTIERLHAEGLRAYANKIERHGWRSLREPDAT